MAGRADNVVDGNAKYVESFLKEHIPEAKVYPLEGTYLLWVDFNGLGLTHKELEKMNLGADLYLDEGTMFGASGRGFERFNLAMPRSAVEAAMNRLLTAWNAVKADWAENGKPEHIDLNPGMAMPDFTYDSPLAQGKSFASETAGKPTLLLFHRYISCSLCDMTMRGLAAQYGALAGVGAELKVVMQSKPERVLSSMEGEYRFPFEIICDPDRKLYDRFNIFTADSMFDLLGDDLQKVAPMAMGMLAGGDQEPPEGAQDQLPVWVAIGADGVIRAVYRCKDMFDAPDVQALLGAAIQ